MACGTPYVHPKPLDKAIGKEPPLEDPRGGAAMRVLRKRLVKEKTGLSFASIDRKERDGDFPARIQLGTKAVGWIETEIDAWIETRRDQRDRNPALKTPELPDQ